MGYLYTLITFILNLLTSTLLPLSLPSYPLTSEQKALLKGKASGLLEAFKATLDTYTKMVNDEVQRLALMHTPPTREVKQHLGHVAYLKAQVEQYEEELLKHYPD